MNIKIKEQHKSTVVGYSGSALPLGKRTIPELIKLADITHKSGSSTYKNYFEELPTQEEIKEYKGQQFLKKVNTNVRSKNTKREQ